MVFNTASVKSKFLVRFPITLLGATLLLNNKFNWIKCSERIKFGHRRWLLISYQCSRCSEGRGKGRRVLKRWRHKIKFLKSVWNLLGYFEWTTSERPTLAKNWHCGANFLGDTSSVLLWSLHTNPSKFDSVPMVLNGVKLSKKII